MEPDLDPRIVSRLTSSCKELSDLWDARRGLETTAIRLACANASTGDFDHLRQLALERAQAACRHDHALVCEKDRQFHSRLVELSGNSVINDLIRSDNLLGLSCPCENPQAVLDQHHHIIDALQHGDADQAESRLAALLQDAKKKSLDLRDENPHM